MQRARQDSLTGRKKQVFETVNLYPAVVSIASCANRARILCWLLVCVDLLPSPGEKDFFSLLDVFLFKVCLSGGFNSYILYVCVLFSSV